MLPLTFVDPKDYDKIREDDRMSIVGLKEFAPGKPLTVVLKHNDGSEDRFQVRHTFSEEGGSLTLLRGA
jgi:aconitate hydratase